MHAAALEDDEGSGEAGERVHHDARHETDDAPCADEDSLSDVDPDEGRTGSSARRAETGCCRDQTRGRRACPGTRRTAPIRTSAGPRRARPRWRRRGPHRCRTRGRRGSPGRRPTPAGPAERTERRRRWRPRGTGAGRCRGPRRRRRGREVEVAQPEGRRHGSVLGAGRSVPLQTAHPDSWATTGRR